MNHTLTVKDWVLTKGQSVHGVFIPNPIDGYLYLQDLDDGSVAVREFRFGDSHPWKDYPDSDVLLKIITPTQAADLVAAVDGWNQQADREASEKELSRVAQADRFDNWLQSLPAMICGLKREGGDLVDDYGNVIIPLCLDQVIWQDAASIAKFVVQFYEEGGCE
jgi:hypothetical protein